MKATLSFVALAVFVTLVNGHGWLITPAPRGSDLGVGTIANASQSRPCGPQGAYRESDIVTVDNFGLLYVAYGIGGGHSGDGPDACSFGISSTQTGFTNVAGPFPCSTPGTYQRNITIYVEDADNGTYYLQFHWAAGDGSNWYNCAQIRVMYVDLQVDTITGSLTEEVDPGNTRLYKIDVPANSFLYTSVSGPTTSGSVDVLAALNTLPTSGNYDRSVTVASTQTTAFAFCASTTASTVYLSVTASDTSAGNFGIVYDTYSAFIDFTASAPQMSGTLTYGGSKIYYFLSYSTADIPKRIVLTAPQGTGLSQTSTDQCVTKANNPDTTVGSDGTACLDMTEDQGNKYLEVSSSTNGVSYSISLEKGKCKDRSPAVQLTASFLLIALALFLAL